jgi:hypothetical protein
MERGSPCGTRASIDIRIDQPAGGVDELAVAGASGGGRRCSRLCASIARGLLAASSGLSVTISA